MSLDQSFLGSYPHGLKILFPGDEMSLFDFSRFVKWFGPMLGASHIFAKMVTMLKLDYFKGQMDVAGAEACLLNYKDDHYADEEDGGEGVYLLRLNMGTQTSIDESPYTISYIVDGHVSHIRVIHFLTDDKQTRLGYKVELPGGNVVSCKGSFENLVDKLKEIIKILKIQCVGSAFIPNDLVVPHNPFY